MSKRDLVGIMVIIKDAGPISLNLMKILPTEHRQVAVKRLQIRQVILQTTDLGKYLISQGLF